MVTPDAKRKAVVHACEVHGVSQRRACQALRIDRSTVRYTSLRPDDASLREAMKAVAAERRRFGYRRIHVMLDRQGIVMNQKKLRRLYREEKLQVRRRGGRKRALGTRRPMLVPDRVNARWSLDFVSDTFTDGRRFRVLAVVDDYTRECLALIADTSLSGMRVVRELDAIIRWRGRPDTIVSDNGTELTSMAVLRWCQQTGVEWHYIAPGKPTQNAFVESFMYGRPLRCKACGEVFGSARVGCVHVYGLLMRPLLMTAGPDGIRGSTPHQRVALVAPKALRALSIPGPPGCAITSRSPSQPVNLVY